MGLNIKLRRARRDQQAVAAKLVRAKKALSNPGKATQETRSIKVSLDKLSLDLNLTLIALQARRVRQRNTKRLCRV